MIKVDKEGVPRVVQRVKYLHSDYTFKITFFNGKETFVDAGSFIRYPPDFLIGDISNEQVQDAYIMAEKQGLELLYD